MIVATTDRLIVRRLRRDDLDEFAAIAGNPQTAEMMDNGEPLSREQTGRWIEVSLENYEIRGWGCFAITTKESDHLIGFGGFARPPDRPGIVELIYAFPPEHWGRGYATEVARAIVQAGFNDFGMTRIEATIDPRNSASRRVLEKIGMTPAGTLDEDGVEIEIYAIEKPAS